MRCNAFVIIRAPSGVGPRGSFHAESVSEDRGGAILRFLHHRFEPLERHHHRSGDLTNHLRPLSRVDVRGEPGSSRVFIAEAIIKIVAVWPHPSHYFKNGWNVFDFSIVLFSLIPATGQFAMVARLLRLLRVVRLISTIPELRLIVPTLIRSLPSMGHVVMLMSIIFYIYAVAGYHLFHTHAPVHWGNLGLGLLTLFRIVTLEDWTDVMDKAMEMHHLTWIYFVSFVVFGTFVVVNLFIAVVLNNLEEAKRLEALQGPPDDLLTTLRETQVMLAKLQTNLSKREPSSGS